MSNTLSNDIIQEINTIRNSLNDISNEYSSSNIEFETYEQYSNDYINRIREKLPDTVIIKNVKTQISITKRFAFKIILKHNNIMMWNIGVIHKNSISELKNKITIFKVDYEKRLPYYVFDEYYNCFCFTNINETQLYNHDSINDYVDSNHQITIKEVLRIHDIDLDDSSFVKLQDLIDDHIENEQTIYFEGEEYKIYNSSSALVLNNLVLKYYKPKKSVSYCQMYLNHKDDRHRLSRKCLAQELDKETESELESEHHVKLKKLKR
jgi:hypothetical protein